MTEKKVSTKGGTFVGNDVNIDEGDYIGRDLNIINNKKTTYHWYQLSPKDESSKVGRLPVAILAAIITSLATIGAALIQYYQIPLHEHFNSSANMAIAGTPTTRVFPTFTPTQALTPTATIEPMPTPASLEEAALSKFLQLLVIRKFDEASNMLSDYSVSLFGLEERKRLSKFFQDTFISSSFRIIKRDEIDATDTAIFTVILEQSDVRTQWVLHKDPDSVWRINARGLIDYRDLDNDEILGVQKHLVIRPSRVVRYLESTIIEVSWNTSTNVIGFYGKRNSFCYIDRSPESANVYQASDSVLLIQVSGLYNQFPTACMIGPALSPYTIEEMQVRDDTVAEFGLIDLIYK